MTIIRKPATFERALSEIANLLGWDGCAEVLCLSESHVRKLGNPDTEREINLRDAVRLDAAYMRAGGEGTPLLECYALKLDIQLSSHGALTDCMLTGAARAAKESGEAVSAAIELAGNSADKGARLRAVREIEEAITHMTRLLARIVSVQEGEIRT